MCIGSPLSGKTTAIKVLVDSLRALHEDELQVKTKLFLQEKAKMLEIATVVVDGQVLPNSHDPVLEQRLKLRPEET